MKRTTMKLLAVAALAAGLTACASRGSRVATEPQNLDGVEDTTIATTSGSRVTVTTDVSASPRVTTFEFARRGDYQQDVRDRVSGLSTEIDVLYSSAAPASECERRMRYLQALRDSLNDKVADLSNVPEDQYESRCLDIEDRYTVMQRFLETDRSACTVSR